MKRFAIASIFLLALIGTALAGRVISKQCLFTADSTCKLLTSVNNNRAIQRAQIACGHVTGNTDYGSGTVSCLVLVDPFDGQTSTCDNASGAITCTGADCFFTVIDRTTGPFYDIYLTLAGSTSPDLECRITAEVE